MRTTSSARRKRGADEVYQCVAHSLEHPIYFVAIETSERGSKNKKKKTIERLRKLRHITASVRRLGR